jgi:hypothetical protein
LIDTLSNIGEMTERGYARIFGGVSRAELLKETWIPVTYSDSGATPTILGAYFGVLINALNNECFIMMKIPSNYSVLRDLYVRAIANAAGTNVYQINVDLLAAKDGEAYNATSFTFNGPTPSRAQNALMDIKIPLALGLFPLDPDDALALRVYYAGAGVGIATNLVILGAYLRWQ